ncbi:metal ABC transporter solute-binding protein, Zn/Mn family [Thermococcus thioreducens]|uniref:ABC transporter substrate-binding protein n=1 Tax=Thermococcus thioreducens TaxID=277988 RepID=A0A0Q2QST4_9EURY|nr:zinc ABC transporter substrate-binding protein [Thermococcus thioreducens]ASJ12362.1 ABC transporter substrate-binding protein [Thermococcus thioreducens]KQH83093.1 ABC transporter substrate-binding protein [Thermococcus thioreducens]SEV92147.1 zinc/manganese transport system substrate-binding protein [Thermococcus thioreducens]
MKARVFVPLMLFLGALVPLMGAPGEKPLVVTTIAPLEGIVSEAFGDSVEVAYLIPPGADPHEYQLAASQIELLRRADVIVTTGGHLPVEKRIAELKKEGTIRADVLFIDDYMREGFRYLPEYWYNDKDNPHGIWLDPTNALAIAKATERALERVDGANANVYRVEYESFENRVMTVMHSYRAILKGEKSAVIQMPADQYAIEWLGIKAIASVKPEEEIPAMGVDELISTALKSDVIVYAVDSPDQLKDAVRELSAKSGKPLAEIRVFWSGRPYTEILIENSAAIIRALGEKAPENKPVAETDVTRYVALSLVAGIVLGTAIGVLIKK